MERFLIWSSLQPAIKLIDFIRRIIQSDIGGTPEAGGIPFATGVAQRVSPTMKELEPLSATDATQWVNYWAANERASQSRFLYF
jgi:hypothetical protein